MNIGRQNQGSLEITQQDNAIIVKEKGSKESFKLEALGIDQKTQISGLAALDQQVKALKSLTPQEQKAFLAQLKGGVSLLKIESTSGKTEINYGAVDESKRQSFNEMVEAMKHTEQATSKSFPPQRRTTLDAKLAERGIEVKWSNPPKEPSSAAKQVGSAGQAARSPSIVVSKDSQGSGSVAMTAKPQVNVAQADAPSGASPVPTSPTPPLGPRPPAGPRPALRRDQPAAAAAVAPEVVSAPVVPPRVASKLPPPRQKSPPPMAARPPALPERLAPQSPLELQVTQNEQMITKTQNRLSIIKDKTAICGALKSDKNPTQSELSEYQEIKTIQENLPKDPTPADLKNYNKSLDDLVKKLKKRQQKNKNVLSELLLEQHGLNNRMLQEQHTVRQELLQKQSASSGVMSDQTIQEQYKLTKDRIENLEVMQGRTDNPRETHRIQAEIEAAQIELNRYRNMMDLGIDKGAPRRFSKPEPEGSVAPAVPASTATTVSQPSVVPAPAAATINQPPVAPKPPEATLSQPSVAPDVNQPPVLPAPPARRRPPPNPSQNRPKTPPPAAGRAAQELAAQREVTSAESPTGYQKNANFPGRTRTDYTKHLKDEPKAPLPHAASAESIPSIVPPLGNRSQSAPANVASSAEQFASEQTAYAAYANIDQAASDLNRLEELGQKKRVSNPSQSPKASTPKAAALASQEPGFEDSLRDALEKLDTPDADSLGIKTKKKK